MKFGMLFFFVFNAIVSFSSDLIFSNEERSWLQRSDDKPLKVFIIDTKGETHYSKSEKDKEFFAFMIDTIKDETKLNTDVVKLSSSEIKNDLSLENVDVIISYDDKSLTFDSYNYINVTNNSYSFNNLLKFDYMIAVRKDLPHLYSLLDKITASAIRDDYSIYLDRMDFLRDHGLTQQIVEDYVKENPIIKVYLPETQTNQPNFYGSKENEFPDILKEILSNIESDLGISFSYERSSFTDGFHINPFVLTFEGQKKKDSKKYLTTAPYYQGTPVIFAKKSNGLLPSNFDITDYTFAVTKGSLEVYYLSEKGVPKENLIVYETDYDAFMGLKRGEVDLIVNDLRWAELFIEKNKLSDIRPIIILPEQVSFSFGINPNDEILYLLFKSYEDTFTYEDNLMQKDIIFREYKDLSDYKFTIFTIVIAITLLIPLFFHLKKIGANYIRLKNVTISLVDTLENANSYNDEDTGHHIQRVNRYSEVLSSQLKNKWKLKSNFIEDIGIYASLHDIGKIGIPDTILRKPDRLTEDEFQEIKNHTQIGYNIIKGLDISPIIPNLVKYHHEKWDGSGYPSGLIGEAIPKEARIVALADVYDALRQKRVYKESFSHEKASAIIKEERGKHFDPDVVDAFLEIQYDFDKIYTSSFNEDIED